MAVPEAPVSDWEESTNVGPEHDPTGESNAVEASLGSDGHPQPSSGRRDDPRQQAAPRASRAAAAAPAPAAAAEVEEGDEDGAEPDETEQSGRDARGRFQRKRGTSPSHVARPEHVGRINTLTQKLRETERQLREARNGTGAAVATREAPPAARPEERPAAAAPPPAPRRFEDPRPARPTLKGIQDANPTLDDQAVYAKYESELEQHEQRLDAWRDKKSEFEFQERKATEARQAELQQTTESWKAAVADARKKYPDFDEVALSGDIPWREGSLIDVWIMKKKYGADVLRYLKLPDHKEDLDRILAMDPIDQAEELTLLGQRLNGAPRRAAGAPTGSSARDEDRPRQPAPRPPNPVRTSAVNRTRDEAPGEDGSLEDHERYFGSNPRMRRRAR